MRRFLQYFRLQLKRALASLPVILVFSLALSIILGIILNTAVRDFNNADDKKKLRIGIVGETEDSYLGFGFITIMDMDISRYSIDFVEMTEKEAHEALSNKKLTAYVVIPDSFVDEATSGNIVPLKYYSASDDSGVISVFKEEILDGISAIMESSQRGIYGLQDAFFDREVKSKVTKRMDGLFNKYVNLIMNRGEMGAVEESGVSDGLSTPAYYLCGFSVMFVTLWGVTCCSHFSKRSNALSRLLASKGCGSAGQVVSEYIAYLMIMLVAMGVIIAGFTLSAGGLVRQVPELSGSGTRGVISLALRLIPIAVTLSAMQFLLYEAVSGIVSSALLQFVCALALSYASGLLYPISFFPKSMQKFASFLPTGIAREYASSLLAKTSPARGLAGLLGFFVVFIVAAILLRMRRITGRSAK